MLKLSYGGFPLILPTEEIAEAVAKMINTDVYPQPSGVSDAWRIHKTLGAEGIKESVSSPTPPLWPEPPCLKLNQLYWPATGASRFAWGYFLMAQFHYDSLNRNQPHVFFASLEEPVAPEDPEDPEDPENPDEPDEPVVEPEEPEEPEGPEEPAPPNPNEISIRMFALTPRVLIKLATSADALYVVPLVDERFFWQFQHVHFDEPDDIKGWDDWFDLIEPEITKLRGVELDSQATPVFRNSLQPGPGGGSGKNFKPDPNTLVKPWSPLGLLVDSGIHSAGFRFVYAPGESRISQPPDNYSSFAGADFLLAGGVTDARIPNKLDFRSYEGCDSVTITRERPSGLGGFDTIPDWRVGIDTTLKIPEDDPILGNYNSYYADGVAPRFFNWCRYQYDETYMGIHTKALRFNTVNGTIDAFVFSLGSLTDLQSSGHRVTTRVFSLPPWCLPRTLYITHTEGKKEVCCDGPLFNFLLKEDFKERFASAELFDVNAEPIAGEGIKEDYVQDTLGIFSELKKGHIGICFRQCDEYHAIQAPCPDDQNDESDVPDEGGGGGGGGGSGDEPEEPEEPVEAKPI